MGQVEYTDEYIEKAFYLWYEGGRNQGNGFMHSLPKDKDGRKPSKFTIIDWVKTRGWIERADALDGEVTRALDAIVVDNAVDIRKKMFEQQAQIADELIQKGLEFLNEKGITTDASALRAIDLGLATQRVATGVAEMYVKISKMSDEEIAKELKKLIGKSPKDDDSIIDATTIEAK